MPYITNMGDIPDELSQIVIALILLGFAKQDAVLKAKSQLGIQRKLTEDEKLRLAYNIQLRFPQISIEDLMYSINLAESMPGYSSGGAGDTQNKLPSGGSSGFLIYLVIGIILLMGLRK